MAGPVGLREVPLRWLPRVCCPTSVADVCFEWVKLTSTGWRLAFRATAPDPGGDLPAPHVPMRQAMSEISLTDDGGHSHDLGAEAPGGAGADRDRQEWRGDVLVAHDPARKPAWLEFSPTGAGASARVFLPPPAQVPVGAERRAVADRSGVLPGRARARHHDLDQTPRGRGGTGGYGGDRRHRGRQPDRGGRVASHQHLAARIPRQRTWLVRAAGSPMGPPRPSGGSAPGNADISRPPGVPARRTSQAGRAAAAGARHRGDRECLRRRGAGEYPAVRSPLGARENTGP